jgi:enoyl-CoA hydratase/carnithine racemase
MNRYINDTNPMSVQYEKTSSYVAKHFNWDYAKGVGTITLNRPDRKNPLTFDSYAELRDLFQNLRYSTDVSVVVIRGSGGNFCSGGDVHEIIGPLTKMSMPELLTFTRMTGDLVKAIRHAPQPVISAIDGICAGAGAMIALSSDLRLGTDSSKVAFLFTRVGLAGADMGACALLPRVIGQGRASELLFTGRSMNAKEALEWGFYNKISVHEKLYEDALDIAISLAQGPTFAHSMTKNMLNQEWAMTIDQAIEAEAQAQAICMQTNDFKRAYKAFAGKTIPTFEGD